jgi:hypothetical protein
MNKKGLSDIVSNILIILLSIVALFLLALFVITVINAISLRNQNKLISISLTTEITSELYSYFPGQNLTLKLTRKTDSANITGILVSITDINNNVFNYKTSIVLNLFETKLLFIDLSSANLGNITKIEVAPLFLDSTGSIVISSVPVSVLLPTSNSGGRTGLGSSIVRNDPNPPGYTGGLCGDGVFDITEQCDLGQDNGQSMGCSSKCTFSDEDYLLNTQNILYYPSNSSYFSERFDNVTVASSPLLMPQKFTVGAWVNKKTFSSSLDQRIIALRNVADDNKGYLLSVNQGGNVSFQIGNGTNWNTLNSPVKIDNNNWHFIVSSFNGTDMVLYINGVKVNSSRAITNVVYPANAKFVIGNEQTTNTPFNGSIDEVLFYNKTLTDLDILNLYEQRNYSYQNPTLHLGFDEANGAQTFLDSSGNNLVGVCSGTNCPIAGTSGVSKGLENGLPDDFIIKYNGKVLRYWTGDEPFNNYELGKSGGENLVITKEVVSKKGGVDIIVRVKNKGTGALHPPAYRVNGISLPNNTQVKVLNTNPWENTYEPGSLQLIEKQINNIDYYSSRIEYPGAYSPISVVISDDLAVGASLNYPYIDERRGYWLFSRFFNDSNNNPRLYPENKTWSLEFDSAIYSNGVESVSCEAGYYNFIGRCSLRNFVAGEDRTYTISIRFADKRNWIFTLSPYKKYFESLYGSSNLADRANIDRRPILMKTAASTEYVPPRCASPPDACGGPGGPAGNPRCCSERGYQKDSLDSHLYDNGLGLFVDSIVKEKLRGYDRTMIWNIGGVYDGSISDPLFNFPPHFTSFWPTKVQESSGNLSRINNAGMNIGLWWGHAGYVPNPNQWNPTSIHKVNYTNTSDMAFLMNELNQALIYNVTEIGLDALVKDYNGYYFIKEVKRLHPNLKLIMENGGPDYMHRYTANWDTGDYPNLLFWYLNPGSENIRFHSNMADNDGNRSLVNKSIQRGFTPIAFGINLSVVRNNMPAIIQCIDGIDNNRNGLVDMYDYACNDENDNSEN